MSLEPFIDRLKGHSELEQSDIEVLTELDVEVRQWDAGRFVARERTSHIACHVILSGVAISHKVNRGGGRQILSLSFAGELLNIESLFFDKSEQSIQVLQPSVVATFACPSLTKAMQSYVRINRAIFRESLINGSIAKQWLAGKGGDAATRVAHLLCEIAVRIERCPDKPSDRFVLPLNQEQIGEVVAVTPLHVGRVMKALEEEGLIKRDQKRFKILDWDGLVSRGDFDSGYLFLEENGK